MTAEAAARVRDLSPEQAARRLGRGVEPARALGLYLAGVRETFEEAGILLARPADAADDALVDLTSDPEVADRFAAYRRQLIAGELSLTEFARREDLVVPLAGLGTFAHWITPYFERRRFDTRFFVAQAPRRQRPLHDAVETTDSAWMSPSAAIDRYRAGELTLGPPTLRTLEQLAAFDSADAVLAFARDYQPPVILPHLVEDADQPLLVFPGDPQFPEDDPAYAPATPVDDDVTRMALVDGQWRSM